MDWLVWLDCTAASTIDDLSTLLVASAACSLRVSLTPASAQALCSLRRSAGTGTRNSERLLSRRDQRWCAGMVSSAGQRGCCAPEDVQIGAQGLRHAKAATTADMWGVGVLAWELLTQQRLFSDNAAQRDIDAVTAGEHTTAVGAEGASCAAAAAAARAAALCAAVSVARPRGAPRVARAAGALERAV